MRSNIIDYLYGVYGGVGQILIVRKLVKNWPTLTLFYLDLIHSFDLKLRETDTCVKIKSYAEYKNFLEGLGLREAYDRYKIDKDVIEFTYKRRTLKLHYSDKDELKDILVLIGEQFLVGVYKDLEVKGNTVIDVGANIGDTAIYFVLNGAKHVYAFEPYLYPYKLANRNIKENALGNRVTLINAGVGSSDSSLILNDEKSASYTILTQSKKGVRTKMLSLDTVADKYCGEKSVLKIDCEGGEYDIILNASAETLRKFRQIIIEYHDGCGDLRKKIANAGFRIRYSRPITISYKFKLFGMLFATRVDQ